MHLYSPAINMRWPSLILGLVLATQCLGQQVQSTDADLRKQNRDFLFEAAEQTTPTLRAYIRENGSAYTNLSNVGGVFYFASNSTDEVGMAITNTAKGLDYIEWTLTVDQTAVPGEYFAQFIFTNNTGTIQEWIRGEFDILDSPGTTAINNWAWNSSNYATVAWAEVQLASKVDVTNWLATNASIIVSLDALSTGKVSVADWLSTNAALQAQIDTNAAAIAGIETGKVSVTDWQNTNTVLQTQIDTLNTGKVSVTDWQDSNALLQAGIDTNTGDISVLETGKVSIADWQNSNAVLQAGIDTNAGDISVLETGKVSVTDWQDTNAVLQAGIDAAQGMATMGGDVSGQSTNATVIKIRNIAVAELAPGEEEDGYGLKYDHSTQTLLLGPVATEGTSISNVLLLSGTAVATNVALSEIGMYRTIRPGNLPSAVINVGGYEACNFDLLGITLQAGSIHLLSDFLAVNPAAYDGTAAAPAYTWDDDRDLGKYRFSYNGDYAEGFAVNSNLVWFWAADGLHLTNGASLFGVNYSDLVSPPDLSNTGNWNTAYGWGDHSTNSYVKADGTVTMTAPLKLGSGSSTGRVGWVQEGLNWYLGLVDEAGQHSVLVRDGVTALSVGGDENLPFYMTPTAFQLKKSGTVLWTTDQLGTNGGQIMSYDAVEAITGPIEQDVTALEGGTSNWNTAYSWGDHSAAGYIVTSSTFTAWSDSGDTYTNEGVFASTPLLTNGYASISYDSSGWGVIIETSTDSNNWDTATATNGQVYLRLLATNNVPPGAGGGDSLIISNIVVSSWTHPATWQQQSDTAGQILLVDNPSTGRAVANKQYTDAAVAGVTPSSWAEYVASTNVRLNGHRLIMTDEWTLTQTGGVGIISYADVWSTTNALTVAHNGIAVLTAESGITGLQIDDFSIAGSNVTLWVSTNGVVSGPLPQYTANLLAPDWQTIGSYTSTYPTVTNSAYKIDFDLPAGDSGFFRVVQNSGGGQVNIEADLTVQGGYPWKPQTSTNNTPTIYTPRHIGDELLVYDSTQVVYRAFGATTNDWVQTWP